MSIIPAYLRCSQLRWSYEGKTWFIKSLLTINNTKPFLFEWSTLIGKKKRKKKRKKKEKKKSQQQQRKTEFY